MSKDKEEKELDLNDFLLENIGKEKQEEVIIDKEEKKEEEEVESKQETKENEVKEEAQEEEDGDDRPSYKPLFEIIHSTLGLDYDSDKDETDDSEEGLKDLILNIIESNSIPEFASDEVAEFNKYVKNGGDPKKYVTANFGQVDYENLDITKETNQEKVVFDFYKKTTKLSDEKIEAKIKRFKDVEALEEEAKDAIEDLIKINKETKENLQKDLENRNKLIQQQESDRIRALETTIMDSNDFDGIPIPKEDKKKFFEYLTKIGKEGVTNYQKDLQEDKKAGIKMAYMQYKGFKFDNIKQVAKTEATKELKKQLSRYTSSGGTNRSSMEQEKRSTKEEKDDFSAFLLK